MRLVITALLLPLLLADCSGTKPALQRIQELGEIRIATLAEPDSTGSPAPFGGATRDVGSLLAATLGVGPRFVETGSETELLALLTSGSVDVGAGALTAANSRARGVRVAASPESPSIPAGSVVWATPRHWDTSLAAALEEFLNDPATGDHIALLSSQDPAWVERLSEVELATFQARREDRLTDFKPFFLEASRDTGWDWRLLAAIAYQESHWDPDAVSPTGVRGLMMLTRAAASDLGIEDRSDPGESVKGGARYLSLMKDRIPERIPEPDRTFFALAAYNIGYGHLEDARVITQSRGGDPDVWTDVRENLPLLTRKKWYSRTRHGYARGHEPVNYVDNVRSFYQLLAAAEPPTLDHPAPASGVLVAANER